MHTVESQITDRDLLKEFGRTQSPTLLAQLVARHVDLVYSVALRHMSDTHRAQDVAQDVFLSLIHKARTLDPDRPLIAWLFTATRLAALQALRADARRRRRERTIAMASADSTSPDEAWSLIRAEIDDAVARLDPNYRNVVLLRFFSGKSHSEIAVELSISENASKKRLERALHTLREVLGTRVFSLSAAAIAGAMGANAASAAPPGVAAAIISHMALHAVASPSLLKGVFMASAKMKAAIAASAVLVAIPVGVFVYQHATSPSSAPPTAASSSKTDASFVTSKPTDPARNALDEFYSLYNLNDDDTLIHIPAPFVRGRAEFWQRNRLSRSLPDGFNTIMFRYENGDLTPWLMSSDDCSLATVVCTVCEIYAPELEGDPSLWQLTLPGDFVYRTGASSEAYLDAACMIARDSGQNLTLSFRDVERKVIVFKGNWKLVPINKGNRHVEIYSTELSDPRIPSGTGKPKEFIGALGNRISQQVLLEGSNVPPQIEWHYNEDNIFNSHPEASQTRINILNHIAEQTGMTWSEETRTVRRLFVEKVP